MTENSENRQYYRLLEMFPAGTLKKWIDHKGTRESTIDSVLASKTHEEIHAFMMDTFAECKQHIFLFSSKHTKPEPVPPLNDIESAWHQDRNTSDAKVRFHLFKTSQTFVDPRDGGSVTLTFLWPVKLVNTKNTIGVHIVILERGTNSVALAETVKRIKKHDDDDVLNLIRGDLGSQGIKIEPLDINKGVKHMWTKDIIDSTRTQAKGSKSTHTETMDEGHYLKTDLPAEYADIVRKPLLKTIFHVLKEADEVQYGRKFIAEPMLGRMYFRSRSKSGQISNVISYILSNN